MEQNYHPIANTLFSTLPLYHGTNITLSFFLINSTCAGMPALLWAVIVLHRHHRKERRISAFTILLIINNILELFLNLYIVAKLLQEDRCEETTCRILSSLWSGLRVCGVYLQQMMVLETDLALRYILCCAYIFLPCSVIISAVGFMFFFLSIFSGASPFHLFSLLPPLAVTVTVCTVTFGKSPIKTCRSNRTTKSEYVVLTYAVFTMILYLLFLIAYLSQSSWNLWVVSLQSLQVLVDSLLCVVVCGEKITQSCTNPNTDKHQISNQISD